MSSQVTNPLSELVSQELQLIPDEAAMQALGRSLAHALASCTRKARAVNQVDAHRHDLTQNQPATLVTLSGELGAGKSVLVRAIIHALGYEGRVKSPTYTLIESYEGQAGNSGVARIAHLDLYRLAEPDELTYLGFDDVLNQHDLVLIEWPEQGGHLLPQADLHVEIQYAAGAARSVQCTVR